MKGAISGGLILVASLLALSADAACATPYQPLTGIVHLHSTASTGTLSLEEVALKAEASGIDVVILSENYHLRFTYNLLPLPGLLQASARFPSLSRSAIGEYLKKVEDINRRHRRVILIPGVETIPHYFWTGSLWGGNLTMHDGQKNILVVGLKRPEDYRSLPITGNPGAARYDARSLIRAAPLLLVLCGFGLLTRAKERQYRIGGFTVSQRRRPWALAAPLLVIGGAWTAYNAPFTLPAFQTYGPEAGVGPHQALIDYVNRLGGATIWSYPEAKDFEVRNLPLGRKFVTKTDPHPEVLLATKSYTAFGAVYQERITAERPGRIWDQVLEEYCLGKRDRPAWGLGELGFHGGSIKKLTDVLTTFYVRERTSGGVLSALGSGRMYAVLPRGGVRLVVGTFALTDGVRQATMGETMEVPPGRALTLRFSLETHDGSARPFQAVLVRNGRPWRHLEGTTPFTLSLDDTPPPDRRCTYYRIWVPMGKPHPLTTNPIFAATPRDIID